MIGIGLNAFCGTDGQDASGLELSVFDVSTPSAVRRSAGLVLGARGSGSEAAMERKAVFWDDGLLGVPVIEVNWSRGSSEAELAFSGAGFFRQEGEMLQVSGRISHREWIPDACLTTSPSFANV